MSGLARYQPPAATGRPQSGAAPGPDTEAPREAALSTLPHRGARRPAKHAYVPPQPEGDRGPDPAAVHAAAMARLADEQAELKAQRDALAAATERVAASIAKLDAAATQAREVLAHDAVAIGMLVAEQLVAHAVAVDTKAVANLVLAALRDVPEEASATVRVNLDDLPRVELVLAGSPRAAVEVVGDASLAAGDCVVESTGVVIDARLASRLHGIGEALRTTIAEDERLPTHDEVSLEDPPSERGHPPSRADAPLPATQAGEDSGPDAISLDDIDEAVAC